MTDFGFLCMFFGAFLLGISVCYSIYVCFMFVVYKLDNGKMKFFDYIKYW